MMIRLRIASLAAMLVVLLAAAPAFALTALEVMQRVDARDDGDNMTARQEMILIDKNNPTFHECRDDNNETGPTKALCSSGVFHRPPDWSQPSKTQVIVASS